MSTCTVRVLCVVLRQIVNEFWLFGFGQRFFHPVQVLDWLTLDQLQQVLVGFVVVLHINDVLILILGQQFALAQAVGDDVRPQLLRQKVHVVVEHLEASALLGRQVV